tara:strand:- start:3709 stop:4629 length:921 start_codon:yes stop_codon:yes gene_type:complete
MKASIDIGTNTVLLLVAEENGQSLSVIREEHRLPRLGKGVDADGNISEESIIRVIDVLKEYKDIIDTEFAGCEVIITATSAVRDASNREDFLNQVLTKTGFTVQLLSGKEEADYTYSGALSVFDKGFSEDDVFVLDIGGGSTEIALGRNGQLIDSYSYDMGCVRFTERYLKQDPPFQEEIRECKEQIKSLLNTHKFRPRKKCTAIGVAGTMTSLAAIDLQLETYDTNKLNGHLIRQDKLSKGIELFSLHTHDQLLELSPNLMKGREDIFLAGLLILEEFMKFYSLEEMLVSTGGIRHGAILKNKDS